MDIINRYTIIRYFLFKSLDDNDNPIFPNINPPSPFKDSYYYSYYYIEWIEIIILIIRVTVGRFFWSQHFVIVILLVSPWLRPWWKRSQISGPRMSDTKCSTPNQRTMRGLLSLIHNPSSGGAETFRLLFGVNKKNIRFSQQKSLQNKELVELNWVSHICSHIFSDFTMLASYSQHCLM